MKANELRLGNYITTEYMNKNIFKVISIHSNRIYFESVRENFKSDTIQNYIKPIQLTEEWLLKFGFEKDEYAKDFRLGKYWVENRYFDSYEKSKFLFGCYQFNKIYITSNVDVLKYVHELQNLYFALTGEELTI